MNLVGMSFEDGIIYVGASETARVQAYSAQNVIQRSTETLEEATEHVKAIAKTRALKLQDFDVESMDAEIGISFTGKGKFIVAEASARAMFAIKRKFK